jgi:hypothetical protein
LKYKQGTKIWQVLGEISLRFRLTLPSTDIFRVVTFQQTAFHPVQFQRSAVPGKPGGPPYKQEETRDHAALNALRMPCPLASGTFRSIMSLGESFFIP